LLAVTVGAGHGRTAEAGQRGASGGNGKGRRKSNFGQHFLFSKLRLFAARKMALFDSLHKGSML
jgi:hypothetical protein